MRTGHPRLGRLDARTLQADQVGARDVADDGVAALRRLSVALEKIGRWDFWKAHRVFSFIPSGRLLVPCSGHRCPSVPLHRISRPRSTVGRISPRRLRFRSVFGEIRRRCAISAVVSKLPRRSGVRLGKRVARAMTVSRYACQAPPPLGSSLPLRTRRRSMRSTTARSSIRGALRKGVDPPSPAGGQSELTGLPEGGQPLRLAIFVRQEVDIQGTAVMQSRVLIHPLSSAGSLVSRCSATAWEPRCRYSLSRPPSRSPSGSLA